ncbi:MAG: RHS repeat domain-containing protein [Candidatus Hydrogenedentales bacterium]|jgi:RHS repeat-associated protein
MPDTTSRIADIPNGMETHYAFDGSGRMTSIAHRDGANVRQGWTYDLMPGGNVAAVTAQDGSKWAYEHDGRNRLTVAERYDTDGTTLLHRYSYTYDDGDSLLASAALDAAASAITTTAFAYNDANELVSQAVGGTNTSFAYDAWGRMTSKSDGTWSATYAYRYGGKLASVMSDFPSEGNASYQYDGAGKRRQRTGGGTTTRYRWDVGWNVLNEEDNLGSLARTHIMDSPLAEVAGILGDVAGANPATGAYRYYVSDHLGSTRGLYDGGKSALGGYEYSPYGELYANSGNVALEGLAAAFTGKPWDAAAQMYFFPYRWYSPSAARWLARDPLGMVDGLNVYAYARYAPTNQQDPLGLCSCEENCRDKRDQCLEMVDARHQQRIATINKNTIECVATAGAATGVICIVGCMALAVPAFVATCIGLCLPYGAGSVTATLCGYEAASALLRESVTNTEAKENCFIQFKHCMNGCETKPE